MLKFSLAVFLPVFIAFGAAAQKADSLIYDEAKKIDWNIFRAVPNVDSLGARISVRLAVSVSKVSIWTGRMKLKCHVLLYPYRCWVKDEYKTAHTLEHEQAHVDIAVIFARRLQKELDNVKIFSLKSPALLRTYDKWDKQMAERQRQFDMETEGGNDFEAQKIFTTEISDELKEVRS